MQTRFGRLSAARVLLGVSILALAACGDGGASSVAARDHLSAGELPAESGARVQQVSAPIRLSRPQAERSAEGAVESGIAWASSRRASGSENAQARFDKYGAEFDAATAEAYAAKARAFLRRPPAGAQVIERANGDRLVYDAKANVFAVADREGLPRTFFHPRDGAAYWTEQKAVEAKRVAGGERRSSDG
jgi:hypothetical protein